MGYKVRRRACIAAALVGLPVAAVVLTAAPAAAHAELDSTEPGSGEVLEAPPEQVILRFTEEVDTPDEPVQVYDQDGDPIDLGSAQRSGPEVSVDLPPLEDGSYVVSWRVVSTDSHPINGAFMFRVGEAAEGADEAESLLQDVLAGDQGGDRSVGTVYGAVRFAVFAGMVLLVGSALFVVLLWPDSGPNTRVQRMVGLGWIIVLAATVAGFGLQAAYAVGGSWGDVVDPARIGDVLDTRAGRVWLVRLALLAAVPLVWRGLLPRWLPRRAGTSTADGDDGSPGVAAVAILGVALVATVSLAGHAGTGDMVPAAVLADVVHLSAAAVWLGGLVLLSLVVLRSTGHDRDAPAARQDLEGIVQRFSSLAFAAVVALALTGVFQAWRQSRSVDALTSTTYGRLLLGKVALVAVVLAGAAVSRSVVRRWVRAQGVGGGATEGSTAVRPALGDSGTVEVGRAGRGTDQPGDEPAPAQALSVGVLRRSVAVEALVAAVVLGLTALLVNTVPAREAVAAPAFETEVHGAELLVRVTVEPAEAGPVDIQVQTLTHGGEPIEVEQVSAFLSLEERSISDLEVVLEPDGPGHYVATATEVPFAGTWRLEVVTRTSEINQERLGVDVPLR